MHYNASTDEYFFQLPKTYVIGKLIREAALVILALLIIISFTSKDVLETSILSLALVLFIYVPMYFLGTSYTYVNLSKEGITGVNIVGLSSAINWQEPVKIDWEYKSSFRGRTMYGVVVKAEKDKSLFIPKVIFDTDSFKNTIKVIALSGHPLCRA